jgi:sRNA-binding protein
MENVLTDILLAESFAESYLTMDTTRKLKQFYDQELNKVIAVHKISEKQLRSSLEYYKSRPEILKVILDSVNNKAIREKDKVYKEVIEKRHLQKSK